MTIYSRSDPTNLVKKGVRLTRRETECLSWVAQGKSSRQIAGILDITERTVNYHILNVFEKFNVRTRPAAVRVAVTEGHLDL